MILKLEVITHRHNRFPNHTSTYSEYNVHLRKRTGLMHMLHCRTQTHHYDLRSHFLDRTGNSMECNVLIYIGIRLLHTLVLLEEYTKFGDFNSNLLW